MTPEPGRYTDRVKAEQVLEWISDGCALFDEELRCCFINAQASALFGMAPESLCARSLRTEFPPAGDPAFLEIAEDVVARHTLRRAEMRDAFTGRPLDVRFYPSSKGLLVLVADVTTHGELLLEKEARAEFLHRLVDQMPAIIWIVDRDLRIQRFEGGKTVLSALGRDLVGLYMEDVYAMAVMKPEELGAQIELHRKALRGIPSEYRANWGEMVLEARLQPLRDRTGDVIGIVGIAIDVTEQTRMQERLRESEERFRALVEHSTDLIAIVDDEQRIVYMSPAHARALDFHVDERRTVDLWSLVHPDDVAYTREQFAALKDRQSVSMDRAVRLQAANGQWRTLVCTLTDLRQNPSVRGIVVNARDVTDQLGLEAQLRQSQKLEALGQLAGGVAHDFNNVLAAISGYAQLLHDDLPADDQHRDDLVEILRAAERAAAITRQLLAFSRRQPLAAEKLDLVVVVRELARMMRALLPSSIELTLSPSRGGEPIWVLADRGQLEQVVMNLALNARDAMPRGGELSISVAGGNSASGLRTAQLEVRDNGVGMSPSVQARAFEPFFTTKDVGRGTGLGLATAYGVVRQYDGSIVIASEEGIGTTVTVSLPRVGDGAPNTPVASHAPVKGTGHRILVVDDEATVREVTARILRRAGYEVVAAGDANEALQLLGTIEPVDLVLTDSALPGMHGQDLAAEVARRYPAVRVILMSGYSELTPRSTPHAGTDVIASFVQKPYQGAQLVEEVRRVIERT